MKKQLLGLVIVLACLAGSGMAQRATDCKITATAEKTITVKCPQRSPLCSPEDKQPNCVDTIYDIPRSEWAGLVGWGSQRPVVGLALAAPGSVEIKKCYVPQLPENHEQAMYNRKPVNRTRPDIDCDITQTILDKDSSKPQTRRKSGFVKHAHAQKSVVTEPLVVRELKAEELRRLTEARERLAVAETNLEAVELSIKEAYVQARPSHFTYAIEQFAFTTVELEGKYVLIRTVPNWRPLSNGTQVGIEMTTPAAKLGITKYAHAQTKPKALVPPATTPTDAAKPPAAIPIAEPEASALKALQDEANKAQADYQKQMVLLAAKWELLIVQAAARSSLTYSQLTSLIPGPDESGKWVWKPKPEPPKTETPR